MSPCSRKAMYRQRLTLSRQARSLRLRTPADSTKKPTPTEHLRPWFYPAVPLLLFVFVLQHSPASALTTPTSTRSFSSASVQPQTQTTLPPRTKLPLRHPKASPDSQRIPSNSSQPSFSIAIVTSQSTLPTVTVTKHFSKTLTDSTMPPPPIQQAGMLRTIVAVQRKVSTTFATASTGVRTTITSSYTSNPSTNAVPITTRESDSNKNPTSVNTTIPQPSTPAVGGNNTVQSPTPSTPRPIPDSHTPTVVPRLPFQSQLPSPRVTPRPSMAVLPGPIGASPSASMSPPFPRPFPPAGDEDDDELSSASPEPSAQPSTAGSAEVTAEATSEVDSGAEPSGGSSSNDDISSATITPAPTPSLESSSTPSPSLLVMETPLPSPELESSPSEQGAGGVGENDDSVGGATNGSPTGEKVNGGDPASSTVRVVVPIAVTLAALVAIILVAYVRAASNPYRRFDSDSSASDDGGETGVSGAGMIGGTNGVPGVFGLNGDDQSRTTMLFPGLRPQAVLGALLGVGGGGGGRRAGMATLGSTSDESLVPRGASLRGLASGMSGGSGTAMLSAGVSDVGAIETLPGRGPFGRAHAFSRSSGSMLR